MPIIEEVLDEQPAMPTPIPDVFTPNKPKKKGLKDLFIDQILNLFKGLQTNDSKSALSLIPQLFSGIFEWLTENLFQGSFFGPMKESFNNVFKAFKTNDTELGFKAIPKAFSALIKGIGNFLFQGPLLSPFLDAFGITKEDTKKVVEVGAETAGVLLSNSIKENTPKPSPKSKNEADEEHYRPGAPFIPAFAKHSASANPFVARTQPEVEPEISSCVYPSLD